MFYNQQFTPVLQFSTNLATPPTDGFGDSELRLAGETRTGRLDGTTALGKTNRRFRVGVGAVPVGGAIPGERAGLKPGKLDGYLCGTRQVGLARTENRQVGARRGEGRAGGSGEAPARVHSLSSSCISRGLNMQSRRSAPPGISNSSSCWPPDPSRQSTGGLNCVGNRRGASRLSATLDRVPAGGVRALRSTRLPAGRAGTFRLPRWAA